MVQDNKGLGVGGEMRRTLGAEGLQGPHPAVLSAVEEAERREQPETTRRGAA